MSETLFGEVDYDYNLDNQKEYPVINEDDIAKRKKEVIKYLEGWTLRKEKEDDITSRQYFNHEASKLNYDVIRIEYEDGDSILVPKYNPDSDLDGNSGYRMVKEKGRDNRILLSETTYTVRENGKVERMVFNNFWNSRRGKRHQKYLNYLKRRKEKKRVYEQERYKRQQQGLVV
tara:strand:- start:3211 stop:3732 length:522 start_codon:yes stop_codon:yes gene_type:complete